MYDERGRQAVPSGTVVVGIDTRGSWRDAIDWAADQAQLDSRELTLAHVAEAEPWRDPAGRETRVGVAASPSTATRVLDEARAHVAERRPRLPVHVALGTGDVADSLHDIAQHAHLLVIGGRHHASWSRVLGTVESAVTRRPPCPVVVVPRVNPGLVRRGVLVGIDAEHSQEALLFAFREASLRRWPLTAVHVAPEPIRGAPLDDADDRVQLSEALAGLREAYPDVAVQTVVEPGEPAGTLLRMSRRMNLVVLGAHHGTRFADLVRGPIVSPLVNEGGCSVAVVPA